MSFDERGEATQPIVSREFVFEILRYQVGHPKAKDTIDGVEKWWL